MEKKVITIKGDVILDVIVYLAMAISSIALAEKMFNLLPFYVITGIDVNIEASLLVRILIPLMMGGIYFLLYSIYARYVSNALNVRMMLYDKQISPRAVKNIFNPIIIGLTLYVGLLDALFLFYPYLQVILSSILREIGVVAALAIFVQRVSKGLDKIFKPVIIYSLMWPAVLMVMLV